MRRSKTEMETIRMERAVNLLGRVVADLRKHRGVTPEAVATVSCVITTMAMLEREIGRRLSGALKPWEVDKEEVGNR